jgi:hypothetical protein
MLHVIAKEIRDALQDGNKTQVPPLMDKLETQYRSVAALLTRYEVYLEDRTLDQMLGHR